MCVQILKLSDDLRAALANERIGAHSAKVSTGRSIHLFTFYTLLLCIPTFIYCTPYAFLLCTQEHHSLLI